MDVPVDGTMRPHLFASVAPCTMGQWGAFSKCSVRCGTGVAKRSRAKVSGHGDDRGCPPDEQVTACNDKPCFDAHDFVAPVFRGAQNMPPASSAHENVAKIFRPAAGFATSQGEQAACLLDKTQAYAHLVAAVFKCKVWHSKIGQPCYAGAGDHLVTDIVQCCEGHEHVALSTSNIGCDEKVEKFLKPYKADFLPGFEGCVREGADSSSCDLLRSGRGCIMHASVLQAGLHAAKKLYHHAPKKDLTPAAEQWLHVCDFDHGKEITLLCKTAYGIYGCAERRLCEKQIDQYLQKWGIKAEPVGDEEVW